MAGKTYSKLAAIGILVVLLLGAWILLAEPYLDLWQDKLAQAERLQRKHNVLRLLIGEHDRFERQYQALARSSTLQAVFLDVKPGALAETRLQRIVRETIQQSGGRVLQAVVARRRTATRDQANTETEIDKRVTVKVMMQGSIESIYEMLYQLENGSPLILVSNLEISHIKSRYPVEQSVSDASYRAKYDATAFIL